MPVQRMTAVLEETYLGWPTTGPRPTFDPNVRARAIGRSCSPLPLPEFWIRKDFTAYRAAIRSSCDVIHRGPSCPSSDLNMPWREPELLGVAVAFDLAAADPTIRLCGFCFTETEINMSADLGYYQTPEQPHADRVAHGKAIAKSRGLTAEQGLVILDVAAALMVRPGVTVMHLWFDEKGEAQLSAHLVSALVRRSGHKARVKDGIDDQGREYATCSITRRDDPEPQVVTWTTDDIPPELAQDAIYQANKRATLKRRVVLECARDACAEVLMGMDVIAPDARIEHEPAATEAIA